MEDLIISNNLQHQTNGKRKWWIIGILFILGYVSLMYWFLFYSEYTKNISFIVPIRSRYQTILSNLTNKNWIMVQNDIVTDCKSVGNEGSIEYNIALFKALGNDIAWNKTDGSFSSSTGRHFALIPLKPNVNATQSICWVAITYNDQDTGTVAYKTKSTVIRLIHVYGLPNVNK